MSHRPLSLSISATEYMKVVKISDCFYSGVEQQYKGECTSLTLN